MENLRYSNSRWIIRLLLKSRMQKLRWLLPYGIARTTTLTLIPQGGYSGKKAFAEQAKQLAGPGVLMPVPDYLHAKQAFGV